MHRQVASSCARGASDRSTPRTRGEIPSVSWKREVYIRGRWREWADSHQRSPAMFEELFEGPIARARQRESPLPDERRHFLSHLQALGYARSSLRAVACELIVIAARLDLAGADLLNATVVEAAARRWATHQMRRHHSTDDDRPFERPPE